MKILVIESSPHKKGSSNLLAEYFIQGVEEAGHQVSIFDAARADLHPCLGCGACGMSGPCCQKDGMTGLQEQILQSDIVVFVTPLYYFGISAQLKTVIDRFYSFNGKLSAKDLKTALIVTAWDNNDWTMKDIKSHYETLCNYLNFKNQGMVLGTNCGTVSMTKGTKYPKLAYELGRSL
jgi:multimeric flavodoxin WrbA